MPKEDALPMLSSSKSLPGPSFGGSVAKRRKNRRRKPKPFHHRLPELPPTPAAASRPEPQLASSMSDGNLSLASSNSTIASANDVQLMPSLTPFEILKFKAIERDIQINTTINRSMQNQKAQRALLMDSLNEKYSRPERRRMKQARNKVASMWLVVLVHRFTAEKWKKLAEKRLEEMRHAQLMFNMSRRIIRMFHRKRLKRQFTMVSNFISLILPHKWRLCLHIRCWRRHRAATQLQAFFLDVEKLGPSVKIIQLFLSKIRRLQTYARDLLAANFGRHATLKRIMEEVGKEIVGEIHDRLDQITNMYDVAPPSNRKEMKHEAEDINETLGKWRKRDADFANLISQQKQLGRITQKTRESSTTVKPLPPDVIYKLCWEILRTQRRKYMEEFDRVMAEHAEAQKKKIASRYTVDDINRIMNFQHPSHKMVKKVDLAQSDKRVLPCFLFWTSFKPLSVYQVCKREYKKHHKLMYGDLLAGKQQDQKEVRVSFTDPEEDTTKKKVAYSAEVKVFNVSAELKQFAMEVDSDSDPETESDASEVEEEEHLFDLGPENMKKREGFSLGVVNIGGSEDLPRRRKQKRK